jgi:hypothetical protein
MSGCNCKKNKEQQPVQEPTGTTIKLTESTTNDPKITTTEQVDEIVDKLKQINGTT